MDGSDLQVIIVLSMLFVMFYRLNRSFNMSKIFALACIIGSVFNPTQTKVLLAKAVDIVHGLSAVVTHYVNIAQ